MKLNKYDVAKVKQIAKEAEELLRNRMDAAAQACEAMATLLMLTKNEAEIREKIVASGFEAIAKARALQAVQADFAHALAALVSPVEAALEPLPPEPVCAECGQEKDEHGSWAKCKTFVSEKKPVAAS